MQRAICRMSQLTHLDLSHASLDGLENPEGCWQTLRKLSLHKVMATIDWLNAYFARASDLTSLHLDDCLLSSYEDTLKLPTSLR